VKISIVTASYNAESHIEAAVTSVLSQEYPNLEYIVIDGASNDSSFQIVEKYANQIEYCISEPDKGQYHAIQKGFNRSSGEIMAWLNADDVYMPWTFSIVAEIFEKYREIEWIIGLPGFLNEKGQYIGIHANPAAYPQHYIRNGWYRDNLAGFLQQESMFWRRSLWERTSGLDLSFNMAADFKLWTEFAKYSELVPVIASLAAFRKRPGIQRSSVESENYQKEVKQVCKALPPPPMLWNSMASYGVVARSICRSIRIHKSKYISYCNNSQSWEMVEKRSSVSRISLGQMMLEYKIRKQGNLKGSTR